MNEHAFLSAAHAMGAIVGKGYDYTGPVDGILVVVSAPDDMKWNYSGHGDLSATYYGDDEGAAYDRLVAQMNEGFTA